MRRKNSNVHGIQIQRYGSFSRMGTADKLYQIVVVAIVVLVALFCLFPMIYVVLLSVTSEQEWIQRGNSMLFPSSLRLPDTSRCSSRARSTPTRCLSAQCAP